MKPLPAVVTSSRTTTSSSSSSSSTSSSSTSSSSSINKNQQHGYTETGFDMRNLAIATQKIFEKK